MTDRQRFEATMHYGARDRAPICDFGFWPETIDVWHEQGLPRSVSYNDYDGVHTDKFFGMDVYTSGPGAHVGLCPWFPSIVLEDQGDHEVLQQPDGVVVRRRKHMSSIPEHLRHLLVDRESWRKHYLPRLDPSEPARLPHDWASAIRTWCDGEREVPCTLQCGSLYGWLRDWMGVEGISYVVYDDPAWFEEMVTTLADCTVGVLERLFETGGTFDNAGMWEDMCYSGGPLLGTGHFKKVLVPQYRRVTDLLRKHGVDIVWIDCDGKIDDLVPLWLDAGVNCMFPVEVGTWGGDPVRYRREYGRELRMMGGFDKHILQADRENIAAEIRRLAPLVEEGGYIPFCDHRVPPDVPYENYLFYLEEARRVWNGPSPLPLSPRGERGSSLELFRRFFGGLPTPREPAYPLLMTFIAERAGIPYRRYVSDYECMARAQIGVCDSFGVDVLTVCSDPVAELADLGGAIVWFEDEPPQPDPERPLLSRPEDLTSLARPDPFREGSRMRNRLDAIRLYRQLAGERYPVLGWVEGPIAQACNMREINALMEDLLDRPEWVLDLFDFVTEMEIDFARVQVEAGADMIGIGDAAASLIGPSLYEELVWPFEKRLVDAIHGFGVPVRLHICGNITKLAPAIGRLGADLIDVDAPSDFAKVRAHTDTALLGNIDPVRVVLNGTPELISHELAKCRAIAGERFCLGAGCEIPRHTATENLLALTHSAVL